MEPLTYAAIVAALRAETARLGQPPSEAEWLQANCFPRPDRMRHFLGLRRWDAILALVLAQTHSG